MTPVYILQALLPVALALWAWVAPIPNTPRLTIQVTGSLVFLEGLSRIGIWMFPPWWTPHLAGALVLAAMVRARPRPLPTASPNGHGPWIVSACFAFLGIGGAYGIDLAANGRRLPSAPTPAPVALAWPLNGATLLVANGGRKRLLNAHLEALSSPDPRRSTWRGTAWAIDLVAIDRFGFRADGFRPRDPASYRIFDLPVSAPCEGVVVRAVDGLPDMPVPQVDRQNLAGNHLVLACASFHVVVAHLRRGSLAVRADDKVRVGQHLAAVGNSGESDEPHLHVHAQRPGSTHAPFDGDPVPITFAGNFLIRGDRIASPALK